MYTQTNSLGVKALACPKCKSNRFRYSKGKVTCYNCDFEIKAPKKANKFGAKKQVARDGLKRDSAYEASIADELFIRKLAGDIRDYDSQFKVEMWAYDANGKKAMKKTHKVDFRIHHNDGSHELLEAKGVETSDYKDRRRWLETFWLPFNPDHTYKVVKQRSYK